MQLLSDYQLADFARPRGSKDKKPRKFSLRKLGRAIWNPNTANAAAVGGTLGLIGSSIAGGSVKTNRIGALGGLGIGTGLGIRQTYKQQNK
jgi:hypothetical protein